MTVPSDKDEDTKWSNTLSPPKLEPKLDTITLTLYLAQPLKAVRKRESLLSQNLKC